MYPFFSVRQNRKLKVMAKGVLFVVVAPSGAGKSTLIDRMRLLFPDMLYSISCTTRSPREGEAHGVHYRFLDREEFKAMIEEGGLLEWKEVHGNLYGTPTAPVMEALDAGARMILDIDVEGAKEVLSKVDRSVGIFINVQTRAVLEQRIRARGADSEESIRTRMINAEREIEQAAEFDYIVINSDLDKAVEELAHIIRKESERED